MDIRYATTVAAIVLSMILALTIIVIDITHTLT